MKKVFSVALLCVSVVGFGFLSIRARDVFWHHARQALIENVRDQAVGQFGFKPG